MPKLARFRTLGLMMCVQEVVKDWKRLPGPGVRKRCRWARRREAGDTGGVEAFDVVLQGKEIVLRDLPVATKRRPCGR